MEPEQLLKQVTQAVRGAGALVCAMKKPEVTSKEGHANFVTQADIASQDFLLEKLGGLLPGAHFFAEEQERNVMEPGYNWVIDPIDGTTNFMRGYRHSAISVGLVRDGEAVLGVVYNPYTDEVFHGVKGGGAYINDVPVQVSALPMDQALVVFGSSPYYREKADETFDTVKRIFLSCGDIRRSGSAALDLCYVAAGRCDGFFEAVLSPWDYAAASVIITEAGGFIGTKQDRHFTYEEKIPIIAGNPAVYAALQGLI